MKEILPFLLILVCPLMMIFMMRGMHGGAHKVDGDHQPSSGAHDAPADQMSPAELRELRDDIDRRLGALDERIRGVEETSQQRSGDVVRM